MGNRDAENQGTEKAKPEFSIMEVLPGLGKLNALVKNIMRETGADSPEEAIRRVNSGEWLVTTRPVPAVPRRVNLEELTAFASSDGTVSAEDIERCFKPKWEVAANGVICITLPATIGRTGGEWNDYYCSRRNGCRLNAYIESILLSDRFKPTTGFTHHIVILPGRLWRNRDRTINRICQDAESGVFTPGQNFINPNPEIGCLLRDYLTNEDINNLGLGYIIASYPHIPNSGDKNSFPHMAVYSDDNVYFCTHHVAGNTKLDDECGFAWSIPPDQQ